MNIHPPVLLPPLSSHSQSFISQYIEDIIYVVWGSSASQNRPACLHAHRLQKCWEESIMSVAPLAELHLKTNDGELMPEGAV
jgi:hypothetical protein